MGWRCHHPVTRTGEHPDRPQWRKFTAEKQMKVYSGLQILSRHLLLFRYIIPLGIVKPFQTHPYHAPQDV